MEYGEAHDLRKKCRQYVNVKGKRMIPVVAPELKEDCDKFLSEVDSKTIHKAFDLTYSSNDQFTIVYIFQKGDINDYILLDDI